MLTPIQTRWFIVFNMKTYGTLRLAAKHSSVSRKVARRWLERYEATGDVMDKPRSGRPHALSEDAKKRSHQLLLEGKYPGAAEVARQLYHEGLTKRIVDRTTVAKGATSYGKEIGQAIRCVRGKPVKRLTQATKAKRLAFAKANLRTNWDRVLFTDRKKFAFSYPGAKVRAVEWVVQGTQRQAAAVNHPLVFNLYSGMCKFGVTAQHQVSGTSKAGSNYKNKKGDSARNITSSEYKDVLELTFLPGGTKLYNTQGMATWVLQQDNDPTHKVAGELIKAWNDRRGSSVQLMPSWPPNSPDLNPIENLWAIVVAKVNAMGCQSFEEFKGAVAQELSSTSLGVIKNLVNSMPKRMKKVIKAEGDRIKY